ncbi:recombination regulator RecX [Streptomyces boninensis]|uniref:recombination regulator RecX n=1 Tax=Streptomyces boninensis TaxID=2039455 RepID=UPI003B2234BB
MPRRRRRSRPRRPSPPPRRRPARRRRAEPLTRGPDAPAADPDGPGDPYDPGPPPRRRGGAGRRGGGGRGGGRSRDGFRSSRAGRGSAQYGDGDGASGAEESGPDAVDERDPAERARAICLRQLTGTPRTRKQLADALAKRDIPDDVAEEVLSRFEEVGLINDAQFADAWVESRHHGRGLARRALANELRTKGVDTAVIDEAVAQLDSDQELEMARELVARKLRSTRGLDRDKRLRRLAGMLARKGYHQGLALRVVREALEAEGEDVEELDHFQE